MLTLPFTSTVLEQILSQHLGGLVHDAHPMERPTTHPIYTALWQQADNNSLPLLIRCFDGGRAIEEANTEAAALRDLYRTGYPTPELYLLLEQDLGAPCIVMQYIAGEPLDQVLQAHPEKMAIWLDKAASLLLRLHGLPWSEVTVDFTPNLTPLEFAERQVGWWAGRARACHAESTTDGFQWLRGNLYRARQAAGQSLVHRNFQPNNLLAQDDTIRGIVDWDELTVADPAVDVAWTRLILSIVVGAEAGDIFVDAYCRRTPEVAETIGFWEVFSACKYLIHAAETGHTLAPDVKQSILDFMRQRLIDED